MADGLIRPNKAVDMGGRQIKGGAVGTDPDDFALVSQLGGGGGVSAAEIADEVWDRDLSGHTVPGSAGKTVADTEANTDVIVGQP